ncbi:MAG: hypothetical protein ACMG57_00560 [Candidatus Dojkabacteria bacterium]
MDNSVLQNSMETEKRTNKKLFLALAIAFFVLAVGFLFVVIFTYGKSTIKSPAPTFNDVDNTPVSSPGIAVGEPNPNTSTTTPVTTSNLTKFTFDKAYGFNFMYDSSLWNITTEPTSIREIDGSNAAGAYLNMELKSDSGTQFQIAFKKVDGVMQEGNTQFYCRENYKIIKEQGPLGSDGPIAQEKQGLIRLFVDGNGYVYSDFYIDSTTNPNAKCINLARSFYEEDENRIDWVAAITAGPSSQLELIDEIMKTARFN